MTETEKTGKVWIMNPRILIIAGLLLLCLIPAGVQAATAGSYVNVSIQKTMSISIEHAFTGTWLLDVGPIPNEKHYGELKITTNAPWTLGTDTTPTHDDYLWTYVGTSPTTHLIKKLQLNGLNVTEFSDLGTGSDSDDLDFSQVVTIDDIVNYYETTVVFTVTNN